MEKEANDYEGGSNLRVLSYFANSFAETSNVNIKGSTVLISTSAISANLGTLLAFDLNLLRVNPTTNHWEFSMLAQNDFLFALSDSRI